MPQQRTNLAWDVLLVPTAHRGSLSERLTAAIRAAIRDGRLPHGTALPPSRTLADELDISRWTVTQAYGQLIAEGYLEARTGSATRVRWVPEPAQQPTATPPPAPIRYDLNPGRPDLRAFPRQRWIKALRAAADTASFADLDYPAPGGTPHLREVLAAYLNRCRGAAADLASVSICFGAAQGMLRICQALRADGHTAIAVEDPGPTRLWQAASTAGLTLVPVSVDEHGLVVADLAEHPQVRAVCVGAAHQFPLGPVLAPHRRAALLSWARDTDGLIVEDDYDAEFRYDRPATAAMQGMEPRRVALLGSVSKTLGPSVGIGWIVTPPRWTTALHAEDPLLLMPPVLNQLALASMLESGAYDRHLREARTRFRRRRAALIQVLDAIPGCTVRAAEAGLHVLLDLPPGTDAAALLATISRRGLAAASLDAFRIRPAHEAQPTLVLGYGNLADQSVSAAAHLLADALQGRPVRTRQATAEDSRDITV
ncbi:MocR-like pyridoxine biosynthesis transcription factor PdxR [Streptomyces sp. NPDC002577]